MLYADTMAVMDGDHVQSQQLHCPAWVQVANLLTGRLAAAPGGYSWVFSSCIALYLVCAVCWIAFARGQTVSLPSRDS